MYFFFNVRINRIIYFLHTLREKNGGHYFGWKTSRLENTESIIKLHIKYIITFETFLNSFNRPLIYEHQKRQIQRDYVPHGNWWSSYAELYPHNRCTIVSTEMAVLLFIAYHCFSMTLLFRTLNAPRSSIVMIRPSLRNRKSRPHESSTLVARSLLIVPLLAPIRPELMMECRVHPPSGASEVSIKRRVERLVSERTFAPTRA